MHSNMTKDKILSQVNALVQEWLGQFENPPEEVPVTFTVTEAHMLCANGVVLCPIQDVNLDALEFEVESLYVSSHSGEVFEIGINWRFAGPPYMLFVKKSNTLYAAP